MAEPGERGEKSSGVRREQRDDVAPVAAKRGEPPSVQGEDAGRSVELAHSDHAGVGQIHLLPVTKILAGRAKDLDDVRGILAAQGETLDLPRVRRLIRALEAAIDQSDLLPNFEEQLRAVRAAR